MAQDAEVMNVSNLSGQQPTSTFGKPRVFVLMPFADEFNQVYEAIKAAATAARAYAQRVDEQVFDSLILQRVYAQIRSADLIVAEMTNRNPNVFYEVGYAHAIGRRVILLTQRASDIPFDLSQYPHIIYGNDTELLQSELQARIEHYLGTSWNSPLIDDGDLLGRLKFFMNDTELSLKGTAIKAPGRRPSAQETKSEDILPGMAGKFEIRLDINNTDAYASYHGHAQISLETSRRVIRAVDMGHEGPKPCRRVPTEGGYMFWPFWPLHELDPSEGQTRTALCYAAEDAWFVDPEHVVIHLHFKGHPLKFDVDVSVIDLSEADFRAWQYGLRRF